MHHTSCGIL